MRVDLVGLKYDSIREDTRVCFSFMLLKDVVNSSD